MATPKKAAAPKPTAPKPAPKPKETDEPTTGWGSPRTGKPTHYYRNGTALCGRASLYMGQLSDTIPEDPCSGCEARLVAIGGA